MTEEDAFLKTIRENPADDTPRLAYADFLDDAGDEDRAALVRAAVACRVHYRTLTRLLPESDPVWVSAVLGAFAVTVRGYNPYAKVRVIRAVRDATGYGLAQAKWAVENLPCTVAWTRRPLDGAAFIPLALPPGYRNPYGTDPAPSYRALTYEDAEALVRELRDIGDGVSWSVDPFIPPETGAREDPMGFPTAAPAAGARQGV